MKVYALHGWAYSTEKWADFTAALKKRHIDLEILRIPGLTAELEEVWDIDDYIKWMSEELPSEPVVLLGHSNGGRLALNYAWVYPERVKHIILLDSAGVYHGGLQQIKRWVFRTIAKLGKKITSSEKAKAYLYKLARVRDYKEAPPHMKQVMQNMIDSDKSIMFEEIQTPTTILWGADDRVTPLADGVTLHQRIVHSTFHVIDEARHSPHFTHAEEVADHIKDAIT